MLDRFDLALAAGEVVALAGASGAGKTTLVRTIAGVLPPAWEVAGALRFDGRDLAGLSVRERAKLRGGRIAAILAEPKSALNPVLRVVRQVAEIGEVHAGWSRTDARELARKALRAAGLDTPADAYPHQLSGGQVQRVQFAMALAARPALLLADEPVAALDPIAQHEFRSTVLEACSQWRPAVLWITHDLTSLGHFASRIVTMPSGKGKA